MGKRVCYIHAGPHKSGTTAIQWFLQENRSELLKHGYFVPESKRTPEFRDVQVRRHEGVGPFTVSVARDVSRCIGQRLTWLQAKRCKVELSRYLAQRGLADAGYCGLTSALARHVEAELRSDNNAFAKRVRGRPWTEVFAADVAEEFTPNDFEMR